MRAHNPFTCNTSLCCWGQSPRGEALFQSYVTSFQSEEVLALDTFLLPLPSTCAPYERGRERGGAYAWAWAAGYASWLGIVAYYTCFTLLLCISEVASLSPVLECFLMMGAAMDWTIRVSTSWWWSIHLRASSAFLLPWCYLVCRTLSACYSPLKHATRGSG